MKLVLLICDLDTGGAQRVLLQLADGWRSEGHDVTLVTFDEISSDRYAVPPGVERRSLEATGSSANILQAGVRNGLRWWRLRRLLRSIQADCVVAFMPEATTLAVAAGVGLGRRIVGSERVHPEYLELSRFRRLTVRLAYPRTNRIVALTEASADVLRQTTGCDVVVIPNSVSLPLPEFAPREAPENHIPRSRRLVLSVGRLVEQKQMSHVVTAFAALSGPEAENWHLAIIGRGPERTELEALAAELGIGERFTLLDTAGNVQEWYERADVFVLASKFEGFPNVLLEAMACGCAAIAYDCPTGPSELIRDRHNGLLLRLNDQVELGRRLDEVCRDEALRHTLASNAQNVVEEYSRARFQSAWDAVVVGSEASSIEGVSP